MPINDYCVPLSAESDKDGVIFDADSESNLSHTVQVTDNPLVIKAFNLIEGDVILIEMIDGEGAGRAFAPFCPRGGQEFLRHDRNVLPIAIPGRYRFILQREDGTEPALGQVFVSACKAPYSSAWLSVYMSCSIGGNKP